VHIVPAGAGLWISALWTLNVFITQTAERSGDFKAWAFSVDKTNLNSLTGFGL
jgi:hypothetical protein